MSPSLGAHRGFFRAEIPRVPQQSIRQNSTYQRSVSTGSRWTATSFQTRDERSKKQSETTKKAKALLKQLANDKRPAVEAWDNALQKGDFDAPVITIVTTIMHRQKQHDAAVEGLLAAIRNGLGEPWMYDILAMEMVLAGRPQKQIDRVLVSRVDFAAGNDAQMLIAASNLAGFDAYDEAIAICKELAKRQPHQPEVWSAARRIANLSGDVGDRLWSKSNTLRKVWSPGFETVHRKMEEELKDLAKEADESGDSEMASRIRDTFADARCRDLRIRIEWVGDGDLDLTVMEPDGSICKRRNPITDNGGLLIRHDVAADSSNRKQVEEYVCVDARTGKYKIKVDYVDGRVVLGRVQVKIIRNEGTAARSEETQSITGIVDASQQLEIVIEEDTK